MPFSPLVKGPPPYTPMARSGGAPIVTSDPSGCSCCGSGGTCCVACAAVAACTGNAATISLTLAGVMFGGCVAGSESSMKTTGTINATVCLSASAQDGRPACLWERILIGGVVKVEYFGSPDCTGGAFLTLDSFGLEVTLDAGVWTIRAGMVTPVGDLTPATIFYATIPQDGCNDVTVANTLAGPSLDTRDPGYGNAASGGTATISLNGCTMSGTPATNGCALCCGSGTPETIAASFSNGTFSGGVGTPDFVQVTSYDGGTGTFEGTFTLTQDATNNCLWRFVGDTNVTFDYYSSFGATPVSYAGIIIEMEKFADSCEWGLTIYPNVPDTGPGGARHSPVFSVSGGAAAGCGDFIAVANDPYGGEVWTSRQ